MSTVMIIGASRGIGLELVRQYAKDGWRVHATTRTPAQPGPLGALAGDIALHALEVRNAAQIAALAVAVEHEGIDVLIHNAGVSGWGMPRAEVMAINADAPIRVTQALLPAVIRSTEKKNCSGDESTRRSLRAEAQSRALWRLQGGPQRRLACPGARVGPTRRDRYRYASRVGAH
jgi:NAD(P)-dependent dehydrogenase (short-subunit alcohol dehydrogenase family)